MQAVCLAAGSIFLLILAGLRSLPLAVIAMIPNVVPVLLFFGLLGAGIAPLSLPTSLIGSVALGIAIDDTVHYIVRYRAERMAGRDPDEASRRASQSVGTAIVTTCAMLVAGYSIIALSGFATLRQFGLLSAGTMILCLVTDLILLPGAADALEGVIRSRLDAWKLSALVAGLAAFALLLGLEGPLHQLPGLRLATGAGRGGDGADGDLVAERGPADPLDGLRAARRLSVQRRLRDRAGSRTRSASCCPTSTPTSSCSSAACASPRRCSSGTCTAASRS